MQHETHDTWPNITTDAYAGLRSLYRARPRNRHAGARRRAQTITGLAIVRALASIEEAQQALSDEAIALLEDVREEPAPE